jgi:hypothetical protein
MRLAMAMIAVPARAAADQDHVVDTIDVDGANHILTRVVRPISGLARWARCVRPVLVALRSCPSSRSWTATVPTLAASTRRPITEQHERVDVGRAGNTIATIEIHQLGPTAGWSSVGPAAG